MEKIKLAYVLSLRNAAADSAGQCVEIKGKNQYMQSPLEYLSRTLNETPLGDTYSLETVIHDDDEDHSKDREKLEKYGFSRQPGKPWFFPPDMTVQGHHIDDLLFSIPSTYRRYSMASPERKSGKSSFEKSLSKKLVETGAEIIVLDGLLVILDEIVRPESPFHRKIFNIHPGITREESPYKRRGAYATLDALHGARGERVIDWETMETEPSPLISKTGASFHYVDNGIDSGEVLHDVLNTDIDPRDNIMELRWNNFNCSLFPALHQGLEELAKQRSQNYAMTSAG
ncbi:N(5)-hydroxyornithine transformylase PvdF [Modicisalibacter radicis]|uniref:N(5)-hydroxyornithine transformylase PvdF n=1 Tax=Halomonas sp. EAR18 TaxID=2518972 RepID=UPI00109D1421|nr:N(5)-hydroxyornithine transformylase PvdF [Halomonas sp. EAR18]